MCGIFGVMFTDFQRSVDLGMVFDATDLMIHRGPDDSGYWVENNVGLGHRRLSIIDPSPLGHQPMFSEDGSIGLVYNGEIYNFQEIYNTLRSLGHNFKSHCDTEVIIHAYEEWGIECLHKFNGMFAFGLWDKSKRRLWIVRDRLGVKPLYYFWNEKEFVFSSEIKPILQTGFVKAELNKNVMDAYLSVGYVPGPETIFKHIYKLTPGHHLMLTDNKLIFNKYWDFASIEKVKIGYEEAIENLQVLLEDSVKKRLISDVPIGAFLSGGLDSSVVVSIMSKLINDPVNTYTVGYDSKISEEKYAQIVAKEFGTNHHVFKLQSDDFMTSLKSLLNFAEEPIVDPSAIALYHISKLAKQTATVVLSGEGSDEIFAGYNLYLTMSRVDKLQKVIPSFMFNSIKKLLNGSDNLSVLKYSDWLTLSLENRYQGTSSYLTDSLKRRLYPNKLYDDKSTYLEDTFKKLFNNVSQNNDNVNKMLYVDTRTWLVDNQLLKADKMTMAASIELRVPFLDYRLVEMAASFPSSYKISNGIGKRILKDSVFKTLPSEIINRKKMGFPVPINDWFSKDLYSVIQDMIKESEVSEWMDADFIQIMLNRHVNGLEDNAKLILSLLVFLVWEKTYLSK